MNKKIFKSLFMGALLVGSVGTLTSCSKDYDNDINDLKTQIAQLETLSSTVSNLSTAVTTAQTTANDALTKAKAAATATDLATAVSNFNTAIAGKADKTALDAAVATLTTLGTDVSTLKTALAAYPSAEKLAADLAAKADTAVVNDLSKRLKVVEALNANLTQLSADVETLKGQVSSASTDAATAKAGVTALQGKYDALNSIVTGILGNVSKMVTDVDLIISTINGRNFNGGLRLGAYIEQATKFGPNGEVEFVDGTIRSTEDSLLIRVSPTTATLTKDSISLMNSQNVELTGKNGYLDVVSCEPYTKLLTTQYDKTSSNGLWMVKFKLKDNLTKDQLIAFVKSVMTFDETNTEEATGFVNFCVAVKSGLTGENRAVVSSYSVVVLPDEAYHANKELFAVNDSTVEEIHNRWFRTEKQHAITENIDELAWKGAAKTKENISATNTIGKLTGYTVDDRQSYKVLDVDVNKDIVISFDHPVRGFYVTLDKANAIESNPSEINAWESYKIENLGKVYESLEGISKGTIKITSDAAKGDIIGFRVYVVNYDGTLQDPDGRAFYVNVLNREIMSSYTATVDSVGMDGTTDNLVTDAWSQRIASGDLSSMTNATNVTVEPDASNPNDAMINAYMYKADGSLIYKVIPNGNMMYKLSEKDAKAIATVRFQMKDAKDFEDDGVYKYTFTVYDVNESILRIINVTFTKSELTSSTKSIAREAYGRKANQVSTAGLFKAYMTPTVYDGATVIGNGAAYGSILMNNAFDGLYTNATSSVLKDKNFKFSFYKNANDQNSYRELTYNGAKTPNRCYQLTLPKKNIDNATIYPTVVDYYYRNYSSNGDEIKVAFDNFSTMFCCIFDSSVNSFKWAEKATTSIKYADATPVKISTSSILSENTYNSTLYGVSLDQLVNEGSNLTTRYLGTLTVEDAHLYTNTGNVMDQYFTVEYSGNTYKEDGSLDKAGYLTFSPNPSATVNPTADVPSTLVVNCHDSYGHAVKISLAFTVKKQ